jgi:hypothetical protein
MSDIDRRAIVQLVTEPDDDEPWERDEWICDLCDRAAEDEPECCDNCNLFLCRRCWGPRVCDDLYAGWCNSCAG